MNIGHFMPGIWDLGGIREYIQRVASGQRAAGHRVHFLDSMSTYASFADPELRPVIVPPADLARRARELVLDVLHLHRGVDPFPQAEGLRVVRTVHEHRPYCPSGSRYLSRAAIPCDRLYSLAGCFQGHYLHHCGSMRPARFLENIAQTRQELRTLDGMPVIAISQYVKDQMIRNGYDGSTIRVVHNPAPSPRPHRPPPREGIPRFLFLGRIAPQKGLDWLLRGMAAAQTPMALDVGGTGDQLEAMKRLAVELGLGDAVRFHGWIDSARIDELADQARAIVFPPVWHEPAGLACMDGSARGRAVIASRSGGLPEYAVDGQNALVVPIHDTPALASALTTLADDWSLAQRLGETGQAMAEGPFSLARHLRALEGVYLGGVG